MSQLSIAQAPPPALPLRFLTTALCWGIAAGLWLLWHGETALISRWAPATIALVHLFTLGVLGNAMLGSLLQFLPVAAGSPMPFGALPLRLHVSFNAGLSLFVPGLMQVHPLMMSAASLLLVASLTAFAAMALIALVRGSGLGMLRSGIATAVFWLVPTAALGALSIGIVLGKWSAPLDKLVDLHAAVGLTGWTLLLIGSVGSITMPMFQGTPAVSRRMLGGFVAISSAALTIGGTGRWNGSQLALAVGVSLPALLFAAASLWLQMRAQHRRNPALKTFWTLGTLMMGAACVALLMAVGHSDPRRAILAGVLAIGIGLPLMLIGMMLEIIGFLTWIGLRRDCARGLRIPGIDTLMPEKDKWMALFVHGVSAAALIGGALHPSWASFAGLMLSTAYAMTLYCALRCLRRARSFRRGMRDAHDRGR